MGKKTRRTRAPKPIQQFIRYPDTLLRRTPDPTAGVYTAGYALIFGETVALNAEQSLTYHASTSYGTQSLRGVEVRYRLLLPPSVDIPSGVDTHIIFGVVADFDYDQTGLFVCIEHPGALRALPYFPLLAAMLARNEDSAPLALAASTELAQVRLAPDQTTLLSFPVMGLEVYHVPYEAAQDIKRTSTKKYFATASDQTVVPAGTRGQNQSDTWRQTSQTAAPPPHQDE